MLLIIEDQVAKHKEVGEGTTGGEITDHQLIVSRVQTMTTIVSLEHVTFARKQDTALIVAREENAMHVVRLGTSRLSVLCVHHDRCKRSVVKCADNPESYLLTAPVVFTEGHSGETDKGEVRTAT